MNCGAPLVMKVIEGREHEACPNDSFVLWRDPKVAAAVVVEVDGGILLGRRAIEPGYGLWCLPGGFVNDDEDPAGAAMRECIEEIGARVELTELLGTYHIPKTTASSIVGIAYRGRVADGEAITAGAGDARGAGLRAGRPTRDRVSEPPRAARPLRQVPGAGGGTGDRRRRIGSACIAAITRMSAIAEIAHAVNPAAYP